MIFPTPRFPTRPIRVDGDVAYVPLTFGFEAVIDAVDAEIVSGIAWRIRNRLAEKKYAVTNVIVDGKRFPLSLHQFLLNANGQFVDHRDSDGLNNRRSNLRICTQSQNLANTRVVRGKASKAKGVSLYRGRWRAAIRQDRKTLFLGSFTNEFDAAQAYDAAAIRIYGEFACTNADLGTLAHLTTNSERTHAELRQAVGGKG